MQLLSCNKNCCVVPGTARNYPVLQQQQQHHMNCTAATPHQVCWGVTSGSRTQTQNTPKSCSIAAASLAANGACLSTLKKHQTEKTETQMTFAVTGGLSCPCSSGRAASPCMLPHLLPRLAVAVRRPCMQAGCSMQCRYTSRMHRAHVCCQRTRLQNVMQLIKCACMPCVKLSTLKDA